MQTNKTLKGVIIGIIIVIICGGVATAAIVLNYNKIFSQANGLIVLSEEQYTTANETTAKEKAENYSISTAKKAGDTIIMKKSDIQKIYDKGFITQADGEHAKRLEKLTLNDSTPTLWAKEKQENIKINNKILQVHYGGNCLLGDGRVLAKRILVVPDSSFEEIKADIFKLFCLEYKKNNPKYDFGIGNNQVYQSVDMQLTGIYK